MKFKNTDRFVAWLHEILKPDRDFTDMESIQTEWLDDVEKQAGEQGWGISGRGSYEVSGCDTKSGRPECYSCDVESVEIAEGEYETTIIF